MNTKDLASLYGVTVRTIQRQLSRLGISIREVIYTPISHEDLTNQIREILNEGNKLGND